jgi:hypothetical protein
VFHGNLLEESDSPGAIVVAMVFFGLAAPG